MNEAWIGLVGAVVGAVISSIVGFINSKRENRTNLYEAIVKTKLDAAMRLMTEAEYLRRGLGEYEQEPVAEKEAFQKRWLGTARELDFHARLYRWVMGEEVEQSALALVKECKLSMDKQRKVPDSAVEEKYVNLSNVVHKQTHLPELDKIFAEWKKRSK